MSIWLIAITTWIGCFVLISRLRRPASQKPSAVLSTRGWFRVASQALILTLWALALVLTVVVILWDPPTSANLSRSNALALVFTLAAVLTYFQNLFASSDIVLSDEGMILAHLLIPWKEIREVDRKSNTVVIITPRLRRYWNGWTGRLTLYRVIWDIRDENVQQIEERVRTHQVVR